MVIAIDVDDTLGDLSSVFIKYVKKTRNKDVNIQDLRTEDWWRAWEVLGRSPIKLYTSFCAPKIQ